MSPLACQTKRFNLRWICMCATGVGVGPTLNDLSQDDRCQNSPQPCWGGFSRLLWRDHSAIRLRGVGVLREASNTCYTRTAELAATFTFGIASFPAASFSTHWDHPALQILHRPPNLPIWSLLCGWWFGTCFIFSHSVENFMIPPDELICFRGVGWTHQCQVLSLHAMAAIVPSTDSCESLSAPGWLAEHGAAVWWFSSFLGKCHLHWIY